MTIAETNSSPEEHEVINTPDDVLSLYETIGDELAASWLIDNPHETSLPDKIDRTFTLNGGRTAVLNYSPNPGLVREFRGQKQYRGFHPFPWLPSGSFDIDENTDGTIKKTAYFFGRGLSKNTRQTDEPWVTQRIYVDGQETEAEQLGPLQYDKIKVLAKDLLEIQAQLEKT